MPSASGRRISVPSPVSPRDPTGAPARRTEALGPTSPQACSAALASTSLHWARSTNIDSRFSVAASTDAEGIARALLVRGRDAPPLAAPPLDIAAWRVLSVRSGVPVIEAATVDRFVPQMLNYELIGGVDFRKGCYPGQEVVARSQYRGTIKRRMFLFDVDAEAAAGQEIFHDADPGQPAGLVVNAAPIPGTPTFTALVEVKLAALDGGSLHLASPQGSSLRRVALPYDVPLEANAAA
jgi:tRNA-modifying protein YgfZ